MNDLAYDQWQAIIGLEIHVQLNTKSKIFSSAKNSFGDYPNTNISPVCTAQPGTLPTLNSEAVNKAILFGLAINAKIAPVSIFERKSYFYPDSPRNYQITQYEHPIIIGGEVLADIEGETKTFAVNRAHLEDDSGMLKHFTTFAGVDFNRAGVPLLEIVSEPTIHSAKEAVSYVMAIRSIMQYLGASTCNMDEGALRIDANISVRPKHDKTLRNKIEIKNMNSFSFLEMAIESEIRKQIRTYMENPNADLETLITPGTYRWDSHKKETVLMRKKEKAQEYRYFPEPDLLPLKISKEKIQTIKKQMPELPHARFERYQKEFSLSKYAASILINEKAISDYFEGCVKICPHPQAVCNWITIEFFGKLKEIGETLLSIGIPSENIAHLINLIEKKTITSRMAKEIADEMIKNPKKDPREIVKENEDKYAPIHDEKELEKLVDQVLLENPESIENYLKGRVKAFAYLVGQVMQLTKGKASPQIVSDLLHKKIDPKKMP